jgi:hypothetical protein
MVWQPPEKSLPRRFALELDFAFLGKPRRRDLF